MGPGPERVGRLSRRHFFGVGSLMVVAAAFMATTAPYSEGSFQSSLLQFEEGRWLTLADEQSNRIPDFSHAGYRGGGVALPEVPVKEVLRPRTGDNSPRIQAALDRVGALPLDGRGLRGAVELAPGVYRLESPLVIRQSGVVLRGAGADADPLRNTILRASRSIRDTVVTVGVGSRNRWGRHPGAPIARVVSAFVPVGARTFEVEDASSFSVGDNIIIRHPSTSEWLAAIDGGGPGRDPSWRPGDEDILYNRVITALSGNRVAVEASVYNPLDRSLSQSVVFRVDRRALVTEAGVESLRIHIETAGPEEETHAASGLYFRGAENCWANGVTVRHFRFAAIGTDTSTFITVRNCRGLDPHSQITGGRRYTFNAASRSNNILFDQCYANDGRHCFVSNGTSTVSGVVFHQSVSHRAHAGSEGHRRWSQGLLFDSLVYTDPQTRRVLALYNRGHYGTAHGWSAVHSVAWNCDAGEGEVLVQRPPTGQNYAVGIRPAATGLGPFTHPAGLIEGNGVTPLPESLYRAQLEERLTLGTAPDAPFRLVAERGEGSQVRVAWQHLPMEANVTYVVEGAAGPGGWQEIGRVQAPAREWLGEVPARGDYRYRVRAIGPIGSSGYSNFTHLAQGLGARASSQ